MTKIIAYQNMIKGKLSDSIWDNYLIFQGKTLVYNSTMWFFIAYRTRETEFVVFVLSINLAL